MNKKNLLAFLIWLMAVDESQAATLPLNEPCNLDQTSLGQNFRGHDVRAVVKAAGVVGQEKDEFTTTETYRAQQQADLVRSGIAVASGQLCFVAEFPHQKAKYDADTQTLLVPFGIDYREFSKVPGGTYGYVYRKLAPRTDEKETSYLGTNAFGFSKTIYKSRYKQAGLQFSEQVKDRVVDAGGSVTDAFLWLPIKMTPDMARATSKNIFLAIQYELAPPYIEQSMDLVIPKIDDPRDEQGDVSLAIVGIKRAVAFDRISGEILGRFELTEQPRSGPQ